MTVVGYQDAPEPPMTEALRQRCETEMVVLTPEGREIGGHAAVIYVYDRLGYGALTAPFKLPPFQWLAGPAYRYFAGHRRMFSRFVFTRE